ncbi:MAG: TRAP transporter large permease subunit [Desulforhopalus sp.]|jgi:tripartite ATP-independent transporter DctM subunit|nr:TRAP transporter large permease subunit [Desulforhopalus sp.]
MIGIVMFFAALCMLTIGYPVAFTFGSVSIFFGAAAALIELLPDPTIAAVSEEFFLMFSMMPFRIYSIMNNTILMAIPLFIFMGIVLQKSELAERLLESMGTLFGKIRGGVAVSTVVVGTLLAASTGVVGASVVAMGVISLPVMLKYGYSKKLATGTICAAGTLGQIIPPSIVLIVLGDVFQQPVGDLFKAALMPGLILVGLYIIYILVLAFVNKDVAPPIEDTSVSRGEGIKKALIAIVPPLTLIILVLGSIFKGIATPTESASVGSIGAMVLAAMYKKLNWKVVEESLHETVKITAMVFAILIGATAFSMVFVYSGADYMVEDFLSNLPGEKWAFLILSMVAIMALGFFIDFFEISYIVVPILLPVADTIGLNPLWFAILIAMNLQTSFLTPPFGFSLFYLKGVSPPEVRTVDIYRGVMPFIIIQVAVLISIVVFPKFYGF